MAIEGLSEAIRERRAEMKEFIDGEVIPSEPVLEEGGEQADKTMAALKSEAKRRDLWALGHPAEIGGGGLPFMDFVYLNEIIGRSRVRPGRASGSVTMQDSIMLHLYGTRGAEASAGWRRWSPARSSRALG